MKHTTAIIPLVDESISIISRSLKMTTKPQIIRGRQYSLYKQDQMILATIKAKVGTHFGPTCNYCGLRKE
jgi:hypothetical protein